MGGPAIKKDDMERHYRSRDYYGASSFYSGGSTKSVTPTKRVRDVSEVLTETRMRDEFNPAKIKLPREARDSALSPLSRAIIYDFDETGSMGRYILSLLQTQFPRLIEKTYETVSYNPHIMFMATGDVRAGDEATLQVTQFETDLRMVEQLEKIWIEGYGGGNGSESYILGWYFAAKYCAIDCFEKRGEKGFMFTFGDDGPTPDLRPDELRTVFGNREDLDKRRVTATDCLEMVSEKFNCYHIILRGSAYSRYVVDEWKELMGGHACDLSDYECLPDLVCTILKMYEGYSKEEAIYAIEGNGAGETRHRREVVKAALCDHEEWVVDKKVQAKDALEMAEMEIF